MASTRAQLVTLLNQKVLTAGRRTTAQFVRDFENENIISVINKTDDLNINGGYLGISSGRVDVTFINKATPSGQFLRDDGTWQTVSTAAENLGATLAAGNTTDGYPILISSGDRIDAQLAFGTLSIGTTYAGTINIGAASTTINLLGTYVGQTSITTLGTITTGTLGSGAKILVGSDATGDIYYNGGSGAITRLADVAAGSYLRSGGVGIAPVWSTLILPDAATANRLVIATSTNTYGESANVTYDGTSFKVTASGSGIITLREWISVGSGYNAIYFGTTASSSSNYALMGDSANTYVNCKGGLGGVIGLRSEGTSYVQLTGVPTLLIGCKTLFGAASGGNADLTGTPTALAMFNAETATANTAPIKFTVPAALCTAASQAFGPVVSGDALYYVIATGAARKNIVMDDGTLLTSGKIPVASTNGRLIDSTASTLVVGGIVAIVASTFERAETGTDANVLTYTTGGAAHEFLNVQVATDISALTGTSVAVTVTWKDSNNATATSTITLTGVGDGTINIPINAFTATNVVVSTVFVGVSTAYNISAFITRLK